MGPWQDNAAAAIILLARFRLVKARAETGEGEVPTLGDNRPASRTCVSDACACVLSVNLLRVRVGLKRTTAYSPPQNWQISLVVFIVALTVCPFDVDADAIRHGNRTQKPDPVAMLGGRGVRREPWRESDSAEIKSILPLSVGGFVLLVRQ